jgi:hypothetical protein
VRHYVPRTAVLRNKDIGLWCQRQSVYSEFLLYNLRPIIFCRSRTLSRATTFSSVAPPIPDYNEAGNPSGLLRVGEAAYL